MNEYNDKVKITLGKDAFRWVEIDKTEPVMIPGKAVSQKKKHSLAEAVANTASGMLIAFSISQLATSLSPFIPGFHWSVSVSDNIVMTIILTVVSVVRSYYWRRLFNSVTIKDLEEVK